MPPSDASEENGSEIDIAESFLIGRMYKVLGCKVGHEGVKI